MTEKKKEKQK